MAFTIQKTSSVGKTIKGFAPIVKNDAKILILGSMPSAESLRAGQYYAHPRNLFWPLMGQLAGARPDLPYESRTALLLKSKIAVWDVIKSCQRIGSMDSDIEDEVANDIETFLKQNPKIEKICFNGNKAAESFMKHCPQIIALKKYKFLRLPSTSPAHAAMTYEQKLESWKTILH